MLARSLILAVCTGVAVAASVAGSAAYETIGDKKILVWGGRTPVSNFDPHQRFDAPHHVFQSAIYEPLVKYQGNPSEIVPWLAKSWEMSPDAKEWTFSLDPAAKFQNGDPVDAEAVRYSFTRALKINKAVAWMLSATLKPENITVVDPTTVKFAFDVPSPSFIGYLPWWMIVNPKEIAGHEVDGDMGVAWMTTNTAGSGPFKVKQFTQDAVYQLEALDNYWKGWPQGDKHLGGVIYQVIREPSAQRTALMTKKADIVEGLTTADYQQVAKLPGIVIENNVGASPFMIKFNYQKGPTADVNLRRAIAYAFDYDALPSLYAGDATLLTSPFPSALKGHIDVPDFPRRDLAKAKEYLAKTPWANGGLELEYVHQQGNDETRRVGLILLNSLKDLGISLKITPLLWANMVANAQSIDTAANMTGLFMATYTVDPDSAASQYHKSAWGQWFGVSHYDNPDVFAMIEKARTTASWDERAPIYAEIQKQLTADQPEVFGYVANVRIAHRDYVKGYDYTPIKTSGFADFGALWIDE
ncbi:MAG: ABC transporter substrate-binding protein [Hyphomicrobiaceae bacterium]|nr:ABC transporter substrate-binding protein [Hyphomicrobiaceae bacterium]